MMTQAVRFCQRHPWATLTMFQIFVLIVQIAIFYPCMVGTDIAITQARVFDAQHRSKRDLGNGESELKRTKKVYEPTWESLDKRPLPDWYEDAKIGIFLHWGVYSVPSFVEAGSNGLAEWFWYYMIQGEESELYHTKKAIRSVVDYMRQHYPPNFQYTDFAPQFTAEFFNPDEWAKIFLASGAKYVVLTSKHHDGFPLWKSKYSWNWNSVDNGPHRDLVGDLAEAVRKVGLKYGCYNSLFEWFNPFFQEDKANKYRTQTFLQEKLMPELHELVTKYKPEIVWSDGQWMAPSSYWNSTYFLAWLYNDSPVRDTVVTNDRWGSDATCKHGGFLTCRDRYNPKSSQKRKWENCMTIDKESWGYRRNARFSDYYTLEELLRLLAETVSYGGNLLMNVGPTADGRIAPIFEERLRQLGEWLQVNGDAIYRTRMWHTPQDKNNKNVFYTRRTHNEGTTVYAIVTEWPKTDVLLLSAPQAQAKTKVSWLGYKGNVAHTQNSAGFFEITLPHVSVSEIPCQGAWVLQLDNLKNAE